MNYTYANVLIISALISFSLAIIAWFRQTSPGAKALAVIMMSLGLWSLMYAFRWTTDQPQYIYVWLNMTFFGTLLTPPATMVFALQYTNPSWVLTRRKVALLAIEPVITLCLIWTDPLHHLFFGGSRNANSVFDGGFWYWLNVIYILTVLLLAMITLQRNIRHVPSIAGHQSRAILLGYLIPLLICTLEILHLSPIKDVDITPFSFIISNIFIIYGFLFHRLLDITPVAYTKFAKSTSDALVFLDRNRRIVDLNPAARELFSVSTDLIGENASKLFSPWPEVLSLLDENKETSLILQRTQACHKILEVFILPLEARNRQSTGWFLTFHDITKFKETEQALQASENKIRSLFFSMTDIVLIIDKEGRYLDIAPTNPLGPEKDPLQILGKTIFDVFPVSEAESILKAIRQALRTRKMVQVDYPMQFDGKQYWYSGNASALDENSVIWVARDITERKQMEQTLKEGETRLAMAQSISHIGSWEFNLNTGKFWASEEYYRIMGIGDGKPIESLEELNEYFSFKDNSDVAGSVKSWVQNLSPFNRDIEIFRRGELEPRTLHCISSVFQNEEGKPYKATGVVQDITEQKQVEKALEKRVLALTRPLDSPENIEIEELFNLDDLQRLQDDFASATGVASIITHKDGTPLTRNSNFCHLCEDFIRQHEVGAVECVQNDAEVCAAMTDHAVIIPCKSTGLLIAGAPIKVGGQYLASWIIGQVRTEDFSEETLHNYIHKLGLNKEEALAAYRDTPYMSREKFATVAKALFTLSTQLSNAAFQNVQQARFISERKLAEEALQVSENKLRSLFKAMTEVIIIYDAEGYYREIPATGSQGYYRPPAEMLNKSIKEILPPDMSELFLDIIHQTIRSNEMNQVEYNLTIGGQDYWFLANVSPLSADSVIWVARDITERKQMEQRLRDNRTRLELAQRIARLGNWECDIATKRFWASDEFYRIIGMDPNSEVSTLDEFMENLAHLGYTDLIEQAKRWIQLSTQESDLEINRQGESQPLILHSIASSILNAEGKPYKATGVIQDITAQKRVEKALEKRMLALTQPLDKPVEMVMEDLFNLEDLQRLQDDFAYATGVASLITRKDGVPITRPSNFGRLCQGMIRMSEAGKNDCQMVDAELSEFSFSHPIQVPCKNIGCHHAGAPIMVGGQHIATWVIGQVRMEDSSEETALRYFRKLGLDEAEALTALRELPTMSKEHFTSVTQALYTLTTQLSSIAFQNVQQARFISDRKEAEIALKKSENKLRSLFTAMTDVIMIFDKNGHFREVPSTSTAKYHNVTSTFIDKSITDVFPPEIASLFDKTIRQTLESKEMTKVDYCLPIGGFEYWFSANVSPLTEESVIWVARDITERKKAENSLQFQSMHDSLTGLYNRQYYETEIERLQRSRLFPISILVMDVDGLKWVNDNRGHSMGDELLKRVAAVLKSSFRPEDMVARMGGDEFVVVLPETSESASHEAVQRLESVLEKHNSLYPADENLGLSIGVATGGQGILLTEVFKLADQAMYIKKNRKKELSARAGLKV